MSSLFNSESKKHSFATGGRTLAMLGLCLALIAGCATTETRPTTPVYSGQERPEPTRPNRPEPPKPIEEDDKQPPSETNDESKLIDKGSIVPRHLQAMGLTQKNEVKHIAVLLPLSSSKPSVRKQAQSLLDGAEMALFQSGIKNVVLLPKDTGGIPAKAQEAAIEAVREGADAFIGPLFAQNVSAVQQIAAQYQIPVLAFSSNRNVAGNGVYMVSMPLEEEVSRIVDWAALNGVTHIAMFGPANAYGYSVETALRFEAGLRNMTVIKSVLYSPNEATPTAEAKLVAQSLIETDKYFPGEVAVLIPEQGTRLRAVAPLLPYFDVDINSIKLLGTGLWNSSDVWREPTLKGGVFAAPDPAALAQYETIYQQIYGETPENMSALGYDATLMTLAMISQNTLNPASIERVDGFLGTNGLFRFRSDGSIQRGLSVLQVTGRGGVQVIDPGQTSFTSVDGS